jgi:hypothetical protein
MSEPEHSETPDMPAGGWGSATATLSLLQQEHVVLKGSRVLQRAVEAQYR